MSISSQASNQTTANSHESAPSCSEGAIKNNGKLKEPTKKLSNSSIKATTKRIIYILLL